MANLLQEENPLGMLQDIMSWMGSVRDRRDADPGLGVNRPSWGGADPLTEEQARARLVGKIPPDFGPQGVDTSDQSDIGPVPPKAPKQQKGLSGVPLSQLGVGQQIKMHRKLMGAKIKGTMPLGATFDEQGW